MKRLILCIYTLASITALHAAGKDGFSFLLLTPGTRAAALGGAEVALADSPETVFSNPAGLALQDDSHLYLQSFLPPFFQDAKYSNFAYTRPTKNGGWAVESGILYVDGFTRTVADSTVPDGFSERGGFSTYDFRLSLQGARKLENGVSVGTSLKFLRESLSDAAANGFATDIGILYRDPVNPMQIGLAVQNLGPKVKFQQESFDLPALFRAGVSFRQPQRSPVDYVPVGSVLSLEYFKPFRGRDAARIGAEFPVGESLKIRGGYQHEMKKQELGSTSSLVNGLAMGIGFLSQGWQLDYALVSNGELGLTHRISLDIRWSVPSPRVMRL